jgi:hypothetical protein
VLRSLLFAVIGGSLGLLIFFLLVHWVGSMDLVEAWPSSHS